MDFENDVDTLEKKFRHSESGLDLYVGVQKGRGLMKNDPKKLRVAISFENKFEDVFDEPSRAEAETVYDRNWKWLAVSKSLRIGSRVYTFTFGCERVKALTSVSNTGNEVVGKPILK